MSLVWPKLASRYLLSEFSRYWIRLIECITFQKVANILNLRGRLELKDIYTVMCGKNRYVTHPLSWLTSAYKVTWPFDRVVLRDHMKNKNHYFSITTVSMATELGRVLTNLEKLLLIMLCNRLKYSLKLLYLHYTTLWSPNILGLWFTMREFHPQGRMTLCSCSFGISRDKLKSIYFHSVHGHKTWQNGDLPYE